MKKMGSSLPGRRNFLKTLGAASAGVGVLAACGETQVIEKEVVKVVTQQVPVEKIVTKEVIKEVPVEKIVTKEVEKIVEKIVTVVQKVKEEAPKAGIRKIEGWYGWSGLTGMNTLTRLGNEFNRANDDTQVILTGAFGGQMTDKLVTAIAGGNPPSVQICCIRTSEIWPRGGALPIDELVKASTKISPGIYFEDAWKAAQWKGKQYGVPSIEGYVRWSLCVNADIAGAAGLNPDKLPRSTDEMLAWHKAMTKKDAAGNVEIMGFDPMDTMGGSWGGANPYLWGPVFGYQYWDPVKATYNFDNEGTVKMFDHFKAIYDVVGAEKAAGWRKSYGTWTQSPTASLPSGVQGANINGYWAPGELIRSAIDPKTKKPRNFVYGYPPMAPGREQLLLQAAATHYALLPKGSPRPEEGFRFIEYISSAEAIKIVFEETGWLPAQPKVVAATDVSRYPGLEFFVKSQTGATLWTGGAVDAVQTFAYTTWRTLVDEVNFGRKTSSEAAKELQRLVDSEYKARWPQGYGN